MERIRTYFESFLKLSDAEWSEFQACLKRESVDARSFILQEGEICQELAFVEQGLFRFYRIEDGEEKITSFSFSGDFISNYRSFLTGLPSQHFIEALQDSTIFKIHKQDLLALYDRHKTFERLGRLITENLYLGVASRLDSFHSDSPKQRYEDLVRRNSKLIAAIPQYMIASYLGIKPETLSRIRARK